jgi:hypothetical protein
VSYLVLGRRTSSIAQCSHFRHVRPGSRQSPPAASIAQCSHRGHSLSVSSRQSERPDQRCRSRAARSAPPPRPRPAARLEGNDPDEAQDHHNEHAKDDENSDILRQSRLRRRSGSVAMLFEHLRPPVRPGMDPTVPGSPMLTSGGSRGITPKREPNGSSIRIRRRCRPHDISHNRGTQRGTLGSRLLHPGRDAADSRPRQAVHRIFSVTGPQARVSSSAGRAAIVPQSRQTGAEAVPSPALPDRIATA